MKENKVYVAKAKIGKGIFANSPIRKNEIILAVKGVKRSGDEEEKLNKKTRDNMYRLNKNYYTSPEGDISAYINHSCTPNSTVVKNGKDLFIKALVDIDKGSEIVFDYSTIIASDDIWTMNCRCNTSDCRGIVKKFAKLPKKLRQHYIDKKIVPKYILKINENL